MPFNFPIFLTWLRVIAIPLLAIIFAIPDSVLSYKATNILAMVLFVGSAITDWLDGYLARRWNQVSAFGAFLDPVADKLLVCSTLLILVDQGRTYALMALIIVGREITIGALREWMAQLGSVKSMAVNQLGKIKTTLQMIALPMLLYYDNIAGFNTRFWGERMLEAAAVMTIVSMFYYLQKARVILKQKHLL